MIDYEKEAEELGKITQPEIGTLRDERKKWLRSHDARVLREEARTEALGFCGPVNTVENASVVTEVCRGIAAELERRASEIEAGEKP